MTKTTIYSSTHSNLLMDVVSFIEFMCFSLSLWMDLCCVQNFSPKKRKRKLGVFGDVSAVTAWNKKSQENEMTLLETFA